MSRKKKEHQTKEASDDVGRCQRYQLITEVNMKWVHELPEM